MIPPNVNNSIITDSNDSKVDEILNRLQKNDQTNGKLIQRGQNHLNKFKECK
jgi:flagellar biosynthesis/type III secretory pathway chaperone